MYNALIGFFSFVILALGVFVYTLRADVYTYKSQADEYNNSLLELDSMLVNPASISEQFAEYVDVLMPSAKLPYLNADGYLDIKPNSYHSHVYIVFSEWDCSISFQESDFWLDLYNMNINNVKVVGIVHGESSESVLKLIKQKGIDIPVAYDSSGVVFSSLDLRGKSLTPAKLFVDKSGMVRHLSKSTFRNKLLQYIYIDAVKTLSFNQYNKSS